MTSTDRLAENLAAVRAAYTPLAESGAQLVVFPENSLFLRVQPGATLQAPEWNGPEITALSQMVNALQAAMMVTTALADGQGKFRNSTILFQSDRAPEVVYSKIHLFDVDVPGAPPVRESDHFRAGSEPRMIEIDGWRIGLTICYDLRFPELFLRYAQLADLILVPSAFLVPTGEAHWEILLRARAIEAQCFVAAPAQVGEHVSGSHRRQTYGHALIADPWGRLLTEMRAGPEVRIVKLEKDQIERVRRQIPMAGHRRLLPV